MIRYDAVWACVPVPVRLVDRGKKKRTKNEAYMLMEDKNRKNRTNSRLSIQRTRHYPTMPVYLSLFGTMK